MSVSIKVKKGLDIRLLGEPAYAVEELPRSRLYAIKPPEFVGINPRLSVQAGDRVLAGDLLFYSKYNPDILFTSPVSGTVKEVVRGKRRMILRVVIEADEKDEYKKIEPDESSREGILKTLLKSGLFSLIRKRPYDTVPEPSQRPKAIYIRAYETAPLSPDYAFAMENRKEDLQKGIQILSKLTEGKVYLIVDGASQTFLNDMQGVALVKVTGPHPAANPSVAIAHTNPISQGDVLWVLNAWDVAIMGRLFLKGIYDATKVVAFTGSMMKSPKYYRLKQGAYLKDFSEDLLKTKENVRLIGGNPLTGSNITEDGFLGMFDNSVTALPEGNQARFFGWMPFLGTSRKTVYRLNFDWFSNKKRDLDTSLHGEERPFVMTEEAEEVMPLDIYPIHLLKACLTGDVDKMEQLGILEVVPEDFALVDYVSSSKINAQEIIRRGLDVMMVEIG